MRPSEGKGRCTDLACGGVGSPAKRILKEVFEPEFWSIRSLLSPSVAAQGSRTCYNMCQTQSQEDLYPQSDHFVVSSSVQF